MRRHRANPAFTIAVFLAATVLLPSASARAGSQSASGSALDPALFAAGGCVAFPPTSGERHRTVFLDAGHGGPDPGAVGVTATGKTIYEASQALRVVLDAAALLRAQGYRVVLSRTGPSTVVRLRAGDLSGGVFTARGDHRDLVARDVCANLAKANILLGVYFNAASSPQATGGLTTYDAARPFWRANLRLAGLVQHDVVARLNAHGWAVPDDGVHSDVGYGSSVTSADHAYGHLLLLGPAKAGYFTSPSAMPGALIEPLFITNPYEGSIAASGAGQRAIASGLVSAVGEYFAGR
jgi:N-acetylmuramoyl-L-alanine amidase